MTPQNRRENYLEKSLPNSVDSERMILGSILMDNSLAGDVSEQLTADDFYSPLHRRVFAAMVVLQAANKQIDPILVGEELKKEGSIEAIGGGASITNLTLGIPYSPDLTEYVDAVRKKARVRELIRECGRITDEALAGEETSDSVLSAAQSRINDICIRADSHDKSADRFVSLATVLDNDCSKALEDLLNGHSPKIKTGFDVMDSAIGGGLSLSDVLLLAADTGAGKSALALQMAYQIARQGVPTAFLAGEMTNAENANRLLSQVSGVTNLNWLTRISSHEHDHLKQWADHIRQTPLYFDHQTSDLRSLSTYMRSLVRRQGVKVLVIDYIQLLKVDRVEKRKRNERIAEASQEVKRIANELGIAIIEVAQFNREGAKSGRATLHDLEGSGQLEKDASIVFILELDEGTFTDDKGRYRPAKIRVVKGRNAGTSQLDGKFYGQCLRFSFD